MHAKKKDRRVSLIDILDCCELRALELFRLKKPDLTMVSFFGSLCF